MKQHGFARDLPWAVERVAVEGGTTAVAALSLRDTEATRAVFPWSFRVDAVFRLSGMRLALEVRVENPSRDVHLPFAFGLHPYFLVHDKVGAHVATRATRAFDNVMKREVPFRGFDFGGGEVDLHLVDHGGTESELAWADGARLALRGSPEMKRWVVWSLPGRDFVCVEPWTAPADALNTGDSLIELAPGESRTLAFAMEYTPPAA